MRKPLVVVLVGALSAGLALGLPTSSAQAAAIRPDDRTITLSPVADSVSVMGSDLGGIVVDHDISRAFVLSTQYDSLHIFDIADGALTLVTSVPITGGANSVAINSRTHRVFVSDSTVNTVAVIDGDPRSPNANTVIQTLPTGGSYSFAMGVDEAENVLFVANGGSKDVTVFDLDSGTRAIAATGSRPTSLAVDPVRHSAHVSSNDAATITRVSADGSFTTTPLENKPGRVVVAGGSLLVAFTFPSAHLERFDLISGNRTGRSEALESSADRIAVDESLKIIYVIHAAWGATAMESLNLINLEVDEAVQIPEEYLHEIAVDESTHDLYAAQRDVNSTSVTRYHPTISPLPAVDRIGGADRYAVAAAASAETFSSGVPVAYVASGEGFADALSGAAAAGVQEGPVLLAQKNSVPVATAHELQRLRPKRIVVLGGPATLSADVEASLRAYSGSVSRIGGADRYAAGAAISTATFPDGASVAYVASGENFPDALSASPMTGSEQGPVLLAQRDTLPQAVADELKRLKPDYVIAVGGPNTLSPAVVSSIEKIAPVVRMDGVDRYAVSAEASKRAFERGAYTVYIASGEVFPDALSGAPVAIDEGAPVLLVNRNGIPKAVGEELARLAPYRIVVLGGENTVSPAVADALNAYLPE